MSQKAFHNKWSDIENKQTQADEKSLFVDVGQKPITQRQLNLYYYFLFIQEYLKDIEAKDVIEVGCGRGTMSLYLARHLGVNMTLMDNEDDAISIAKDAFKQKGMDAKFLVGYALNTCIYDESYDATVSIGLAEHLDDVDTLFKEQFRMLRPGGVMVSLNIPKKFSIQSFNTIYRVFLKCLGKYKDSPRKDYYRNTYDAEKYKEFAEMSGFENVSYMYVCPFPIYVPLSMENDKRIATFRRGILCIRKLLQRYPYKSSKLWAQAHFLVAYKPR